MPQEQPSRECKQYSRNNVGERNHGSTATRVKQTTEQQGPQKISNRKRQDVPADMTRCDAVKIGENQRIGEKYRIVEERLRRHQTETNDCPAQMLPEQNVHHQGQWR